MKKKLLATLLASVMCLSLVACGSKGDASGDVDFSKGGEITIWVADNVVDFTSQSVADFFAANPDYSAFTYTVEAVGEGDAAGNMITDVEGGADIFGFAQDQLARLVSASAVMPVMGDYESFVKDSNDAGAIAAATVGDTIYAYPQARTSTLKLIPDGIRQHSSSEQDVSSHTIQIQTATLQLVTWTMLQTRVLQLLRL